MTKSFSHQILWKNVEFNHNIPHPPQNLMVQKYNNY